jgi:type II secretory pathway component PulF
MPKFVYRAKQGPGKHVDGEIEADSRLAAIAAIDALGYSPVWVRAKGVDAKESIGIFRKRIRQRDITVFTRQLASLTRSGVPILKTLATIGSQTENSRFRAIVQDLEGTIRDGKMLSEAMSKYPSLFPNLYVSMVRSGESAGVLDTVLSRLAEARENEEDLRRKVQSAVAYPLLIVVVGIATVVVLLAFFLPRVAELFKSHESLPLPTRMLMDVSAFFSEQWFWLLCGVLLVGAILRRLASLEKGRNLIDSIKLRVPLLNRFIVQSDIARFARTLSLLIESGISIDKALALSADTLRNSVLKDEITGVRKATVQQGHSLSSGLKRTHFFPPFVSSMAAVGEEAGRLDESMNEIASFYEKEVDQLCRLATSLIEPLLILIVGCVVGFIVAAMLLPIFEIGSGL